MATFKCANCKEQRPDSLKRVVGPKVYCLPCIWLMYRMATAPTRTEPMRRALARRQKLETSRREESAVAEQKLRDQYQMFTGELRTCSSCNLTLPVELFHKRWANKVTLSSRCRVCSRVAVARTRFRQAGRPCPESLYSRVVLKRLLGGARHGEGHEAKSCPVALINFAEEDLAVFPEVTFEGTWLSDVPKNLLELR
jgi:hypothetical protein